jgi:hypothetical protein
MASKTVEYIEFCEDAREALCEASALGGRMGKEWIAAKLAEIEADAQVTEGPEQNAFGEIINDRRTKAGSRVLEGVYAIRKHLHDENGRWTGVQWMAGYQVFVAEKMFGGSEFRPLDRMFKTRSQGREYADALVMMGGGEVENS